MHTRIVYTAAENMHGMRRVALKISGPSVMVLWGEKHSEDRPLGAVRTGTICIRNGNRSRLFSFLKNAVHRASRCIRWTCFIEDIAHSERVVNNWKAKHFKHIIFKIQIVSFLKVKPDYSLLDEWFDGLRHLSNNEYRSSQCKPLRSLFSKNDESM